MKNFNFYIIILTITSFLLAACAAFFSVFGLSKLFAGAGISIILMASTLELGKIVAVSYINRFWSDISISLKIYLLTGIVILMLLTSLGVYGFLSNAYQIKADEYSIVSKKIEIETTKKNIFEKEILYNKEIIKSKSDRILMLNNVRKDQESRLNNQYDSKNYQIAKRVENNIEKSSNEVSLLNSEINDLSRKIFSLNDSISNVEMKILSMNNTDVSAEIGPLRYISDLSGVPMNKITNILILLIIFVFDPLAMAFVISINKVIELKKKEHKDKTDSITNIKTELNISKSNIDDRFEQINKRTSGLRVESQIN